MLQKIFSWLRNTYNKIISGIRTPLPTFEESGGRKLEEISGKHTPKNVLEEGGACLSVKSDPKQLWIILVLLLSIGGALFGLYWVIMNDANDAVREVELKISDCKISGCVEPVLKGLEKDRYDSQLDYNVNVNTPASNAIIINGWGLALLVIALFSFIIFSFERVGKNLNLQRLLRLEYTLALLFFITGVITYFFRNHLPVPSFIIESKINLIGLIAFLILSIANLLILLHIATCYLAPIVVICKKLIAKTVSKIKTSIKKIIKR